MSIPWLVQGRRQAAPEPTPVPAGGSERPPWMDDDTDELPEERGVLDLVGENPIAALAIGLLVIMIWR